MQMYKKNRKLNSKITSYLRDAYGGSAVAHEHLIGGGAVRELEMKIADHYRAKYALCVTSGTSGLLAIALALDLKDSGFVTTPLTFGASLASFLAFGNRPVFVDVDQQTLTLDAKLITEEAAQNAKAILAVDIFGNPSDSAALRSAADRFGLWYIADAAQAFGATRGGEPASHLADAIVLSFTVNKTVSCGEGGAIVTNNEELYKKLLWVSQHPLRQKRELGLDAFNEFAVNMRIHPLGAIWANATFRDALNALEVRQKSYFRAIELLNDSSLTENIEFGAADIRPSFFCLPVELAREATAGQVVDWLSCRGVRARSIPLPSGVVYKSPAFLEQFKNRFSVPAGCVVAERAEKRVGLILD